MSASSSQEMADFTKVNPTQIRRDLSGFGKFGKRGVGYDVQRLIEEIRKILRTQGQYNMALFGAGRLGQAVARSAVFADHGFTIAAVFDVDPDKVGELIGNTCVSDSSELEDVLAGHNVTIAVLAVPATAAQRVADRCNRGRHSDHLQLLGGARSGTVGRGLSTRRTRQPSCLHALYFSLA